MTSEERVNGDESEEFIALVTASGLKLDTNPDNVTSPFEPTQNLTLDRQRELATDSQSNLVDAPGFVNSYDVDTEGTNQYGQYKLNRLFSNFQQGAGYVAIATASGFSTDYATVYVQEDGFLNEDQVSTVFNLEPEAVEPANVDIVQQGVLANADAAGTTEAETLANANLFEVTDDDVAQRISRNGSAVDVFRVNVSLEDGTPANGTVEVAIDDQEGTTPSTNFEGQFLGVVGGTELSNPGGESFTFATGTADEEARSDAAGTALVLLQSDDRTVDITTNKTATLTNDRSATDRSRVLFAGVTEFSSASISGIVTDSQDTPIPGSAVWASEFTFGEEDQDPGTPGVQEETRFTIEPITPPGVNPPGQGEESAAYAEEVDDLDDDFLVSQLEFRNDTQPNVTGNQSGYVSVDNETVTARQLRNYTFGELEAVEIEADIEGGFTLYDRADDTEDASYTLDPVPAINAGDLETRYEVSAVKFTDNPAQDNDLGRRANPGRASVLPRTTDDANIVIPITLQDPVSNVTVTGLSAPSEVEPDQSFTVEATVENTGTGDAVGEDVEFRFDFDNNSNLTTDEVVATQSVDVAAGATETVTFDLNASDLGVALGTYAHGVAVPSTETSRTAQITITENATNGGNGNVTAPVVDGTTTTDPDGDGLYEDLNGDGDFTIIDVSVFLDAYTGDDVMDNTEQFDFNDDDSITITDVAELLNELNEA
jgi:hypothetical protein